MASQFDASVKGRCSEILTDMTNFMKGNAPEYYATKNGTLAAITSNYNVGATEIELGQADGTIRRARVRYISRKTTDAISTDFDDITCGTGTSTVFKETTLEISEEICIDGGITITENEMKKLCMTNADYQSWRDRVLMTYINSLHTKLDQEILTKISLNCIGVNVKNKTSLGVPLATAKTINVLSGDCKSACTDGVNELLIDYEDNEQIGAPIIIGQGNWEKLMLNLGYGCCNDYGVDFGKVQSFISSRGYAFYKDQNANAILGDDQILVLAPNAVQFVSWNAFDGMEIPWNGSFAHLTMPDPKYPGLMWDFHLKYNDCTDRNGNGTYWLNLKLMWDVFCAPSDVFESSDPMYGVTGVFRYEATAI